MTTFTNTTTTADTTAVFTTDTSAATTTSTTRFRVHRLPVCTWSSKETVSGTLAFVVQVLR
jgi:hypothetical protein